MSEVIGDDHVNMLRDKVDFKKFKAGAVFEINTDNIEEAIESSTKKDRQSYDREQPLKTMPVTLSDDDEDNEALGMADYATLASKMMNITADGKIKKRVIRPGHGPTTPPTALVEVHYDAYYEFGDEAFDSTYLRGQALKFVPATGDCIVGLSKAVNTMQKGEVARFLVHYEYGYGKFGVPPRIPPAVELLFEIQLINFIDGVQTKTIHELNGGEILVTEKAIIAKHLQGNELFAKKVSIKDATDKYNKALSMIEEYISVNKGDFEKYKPRMTTLCSNLALCHLKKKKYGEAVKICDRALSIDPNHCKSLFLYGRALLNMTEYDDAKVKLLKAQKLEPTNKDINSEILKLEMLHRQYKSKSKEISERMFRKEKTEIAEVSSPSKWRIYLSAFQDEEKDLSFVLVLLANMPEAEVDEIKAEARLLGMVVTKEKDRLVIRKTECK